MTDPMAVDGIKKWTMTPSRKAREISRVSTINQSDPARVWTMSGLTRDGTGRPNLSRETKFSGANRDLSSWPQAELATIPGCFIISWKCWPCILCLKKNLNAPRPSELCYLHTSRGGTFGMLTAKTIGGSDTQEKTPKTFCIELMRLSCLRMRKITWSETISAKDRKVLQVLVA